MRIFSVVKSLYKSVKFLIKSNTPLWMIGSYLYFYLKLTISNKYTNRGKSYKNKLNDFRCKKNNLLLSDDWFTKNIPFWLRAIDTSNIREKQKIDCLEIGSWEGLSAFFILNELPNAMLTCVDTWEGADEHKDLAVAGVDIISNVEKSFDANLSTFRDRLIKYKGSSLIFFSQNSVVEKYDLIYVDGSHHSDDVMVDAVKCFEMLKVGGLMIFDDYFWKYYPNHMDNPAGAINSFVRLKRHQLQIISFDSQLIVRKTIATSR